MLKHLSILIIAIICYLPNNAYSQESVRIVVLPFEIYSHEDISYLEDEISAVIGKHLKEDGAIVLDSEPIPVLPDSTGKVRAVSINEIRTLGIKNGADYVIWGSLTWIGKKYSLDAKMLESFGEKPPNIFFAEGESIENLPGSIKDIATDIGMKLFEREKVAQVLVAGNKRIEADAIKRKITTVPGDIYLAKKLADDLKSVFSMGYFDDVRIEAESGPKGKILTFVVKEKSTIRVIRIKGNRVFDDEDIKESLNIRTGSILNIFKIRGNIKRIGRLYKDKNYHNVKVAYNIGQLQHNQADLEFIIEEGEKLRIKRITFEGNTNYTNKKLKGMMKLSEKGFFSWLTSSGELNREDLSQDVAKLAAFYHNNGYIQARISDPHIEYKDNWIDITIKIFEGPQFKVGKVDISGDLVLPKEELTKKLKIIKEKFYNREVVRNDVLVLNDLYSDEGYAYANVSPRIDQNMDKFLVNITYVIDKGKQVYFEKIIIRGNTKTRDKVVRRELKVYEQELYSGKRLKRGVRNLYRLDFFEDVKVNTSKGSTEEKMILEIDVTEKPTGIFSFGGGYSNVEDVFVVTSIAQKNLFGRGQTLRLKAQMGGTTNKYTLSFTEPWLFDIPLSAGFDIYNWQTDYDTYDKDSKGAGVRFSYPVLDFTRAYLSYAFDVGNITNVNQVYASDLVKESEGENIKSSITTALRYDSRDRMFNPTEGSEHSISIQYAGIGGDIGFTKYVGKTGWYFPLFMDTVGFLHGKAGYVNKISGKKLFDYDRFYLGGMNSLRGFDWRDISPVDENGDKIGGDKFVHFNAELLIPVFKKAGLIGVVFYDTGNVYAQGENMDLGNLRESAGYGFRWYSPLGPIRLENGYIINPKDGENKGGRWEFTMGTAF
ncbi:MAG: outer membrane protein insertion porin family [Desulfobacteraceae bacterium Eth-SRB1]|nr:MAG: outer membrane protein insertion porin family [Desulfobacteraceae bacterium Eth-SRB1]